MPKKRSEKEKKERDLPVLLPNVTSSSVEESEEKIEWSVETFSGMGDIPLASIDRSNEKKPQGTLYVPPPPTLDSEAKRYENNLLYAAMIAQWEEIKASFTILPKDIPSASYFRDPGPEWEAVRVSGDLVHDLTVSLFNMKNHPMYHPRQGIHERSHALKFYNATSSSIQRGMLPRENPVDQAAWLAELFLIALQTGYFSPTTSHKLQDLLLQTYKDSDDVLEKQIIDPDRPFPTEDQFKILQHIQLVYLAFAAGSRIGKDIKDGTYIPYRFVGLMSYRGFPFSITRTQKEILIEIFYELERLLSALSESSRLTQMEKAQTRRKEAKKAEKVQKKKEAQKAAASEKVESAVREDRTALRSDRAKSLDDTLREREEYKSFKEIYRPTGTPKTAEYIDPSEYRETWAQLIPFEPHSFSKRIESFHLSWAPTRPHDEGAIPRHMHRWASDKKIFSTTGKSLGGAMTIDLSGSMSLTSEQIENFVHLLPNSEITAYASGYPLAVANPDNWKGWDPIPIFPPAVWDRYLFRPVLTQGVYEKWHTKFMTSDVPRSPKPDAYDWTIKHILPWLRDGLDYAWNLIHSESYNRSGYSYINRRGQEIPTTTIHASLNEVAPFLHLAKDGRRITKIGNSMPVGGNGADLPALKWVHERRPVKGLWISDGQAHGVTSSGMITRGAMIECAAYADAHHITRVYSVDDAAKLVSQK